MQPTKEGTPTERVTSAFDRMTRQYYCGVAKVRTSASVLNEWEIEMKRPGSEEEIELNTIIAIIPNPDDLKAKSSIFHVRSDTNSKSLAIKHVRTTSIPQALLERFALPEKRSQGFTANHPTDSQQHTRHVIVSTGSGTGTALQVWQALVHPLLTRLNLHQTTDYTLHVTESATSVSSFVETHILASANRGAKQSLLLLSGDGGIVDVVNTLLSTTRAPSFAKPAVSLLPLGTGNALANSSLPPSDGTLGLRALLVGTPKALPLFRATFSAGARLLVDQAQREEELQSSFDGAPTAHGAVVCSWGHHAALVADSDTRAYRRFGSARFQMAAREALFPGEGTGPHAYRGRVRVRRSPASTSRQNDGWEDLGEGSGHGYVLATFARELEKGFAISPAARPLDGKLRVVYFGALSGEEAMEVMTLAFQGGGHVRDERVRYEEVRGLRIEFDEDDARWRRVCVDGKIIRVEKDGWVEVGTDVDGVVDLVCLDS